VTGTGPKGCSLDGIPAWERRSIRWASPSNEEGRLYVADGYGRVRVITAGD
jgi:TPP-dependent 2-oxoacid decarboxylase